MENMAREDLSSLFGKFQGTMQSQALGQQVNSGFYVSQGADEVCGISEDKALQMHMCPDCHTKPLSLAEF